MNIVILGPAHPLRGGGMTTFNERLALALQDAGHSVTIYSFSLQYPGFLFPGSSQFTDEPPPKGIKIKSIVEFCKPFELVYHRKRIEEIKARFYNRSLLAALNGPCIGYHFTQGEKEQV